MPLPFASMNLKTDMQATAAAPLTLKLSTLEKAGTKPWKQPLPQGLSTLVGSPRNWPTGVTQALYTPPGFGVSSNGTSTLFTFAQSSTVNPPLPPVFGKIGWVEAAVIKPPETVIRRFITASLLSRVFPLGSVTWK